MNKLASTIIFFGNGPVAATSLQGLVDNFGTDAVEVVVTKTKPAHHKEPAPVEVLAESLGLTVWFASTKAELDSLITDKKPKSKLGLVIDYGVIISLETISSFEKGIINSHFSLLPEWRGADPITYSLLSGQAQTGVSIMLIDEGLDTGPLLATATLDIDTNETANSLTTNLLELSNTALAHVLPLYITDELVASEQQNLPVTHSRKLTKSDGKLLWSKTASELEREVRAFEGWPKSRTSVGNIECAVIKSEICTENLKPGELQIVEKKRIIFGCRQGSLEVLELQPVGKNKMSASSFLNGYGHIFV